MKQFLTIQEAVERFPILTPSLIKKKLTPYAFHDTHDGYYIEDLAHLSTMEALKNFDKKIS